MMKFLGLALVLLFVNFLSSCSSASKIEALKPEPDDASPLRYETAASYINLPIAVKLKDIENQINKFMQGLIFEDTNIEDDNIELKIWKFAPISIQSSKEPIGEKIKTILPLKAVIKYRIGTNTLGLNLYNTKELNLNGVVTLVSDFEVNNWKLSTKTELKSLDWNESPTVLIMGKNVPITYLINPAVKIFRSKIEASIDEAIDKSVDFKPNIIATIEKLSSPFKVNDTYESWLQVNPLEIYTSSAQLKNEALHIKMGMKCTMNTIIGGKPNSKFDASKILMLQKNTIPNQISANVAIVSTYLDASKIVAKNFAGQEFGSDKRKVTVQQVKLWHKAGKMVVALDVLGSLNGTIYLTGVPQYDDKKKEIYFDQMDFVLDTKNKLIKTASWLSHGLILNKIQQNCRYSITPLIEDAKKNLTTYLTNYNPMPGIFVNGKLQNIAFQKIQMTNKAIVAFTKMEGTASVTIDGLE